MIAGCGGLPRPVVYRVVAAAEWFNGRWRFMSARLKFNVGMAIALAIAVVAGAWLASVFLQREAREHVMQRANLLMAAAEATRAYTTAYIKPQLDQRLDIEFLPQTVPAFAATETVMTMRKQFPEYTYKEATLNPTNPRDRTSDWEADIVNLFRADPSKQQIVGERMQGPIASMYIAKPITITNASCLSCHSTPSAAPASMLKLYGEANGFGWKHGEIIGAQIVTVPLAVSEGFASSALWAIVGLMAAIALVALVVGNLFFGRTAATEAAASPAERESSSARRWARH